MSEKRLRFEDNNNNQVKDNSNNNNNNNNNDDDDDDYGPMPSSIKLTKLHPGC